MQQSEIKAFLKEYASKNYHGKEHERFIEWLNTASVQEIEKVAEEYAAMPGKRPFSDKSYPEIITRIEAALDRSDYDTPGAAQIKTTPPVRRIRKIWTTAAAAVIIGGLLIPAYRWLDKKPEEKAPQESVASAGDIQAPQHTKATITLHNGQVIALNSIDEGVLARQGEVGIVKTTGAGIVYKSEPGSVKQYEARYNTLYNPQGSMVVSLVLSDGTKVWLNAESSLHYPVSFNGDHRKVEITGEAYFEVAKDPKRKFLVDADGITTEVLGTQFNINAYQDEDQTIVTLLEGAVKVRQQGSSAVMKPGQQAVIANDIRISDHADLETAMAWKNGKFMMKSAGVSTIARQIARWYDVEIAYKDGVPEGTISGEISRDSDLSEVLKILQLSGVHLEMDGKKVWVLP